MLANRLALAFAAAQAVGLLLAPASLNAAMPLDEALREKPVLSNLLPNRARVAECADALGLSQAERAHLEALVLEEKEGVMALLELSRPVIEDAGLADAQKQAELERLDYNGRVAGLGRRSAEELRTLLGPEQWQGFLAWGRRAWEADASQGGARTVEAAGVTKLQYKVYATQYDAYTTNEVAVPDKYVKFAAQGTQYASGYPKDLDYRVILDRSSYSYTVRVYEVGPWNIDDNYWNAANDPERPRRMFKDLPQGKPEAQAAYYDKYNGGKDQYGRTVANPAGVDLAVEVAPKLGLAYLENDWVYVTYLWEDGSSGGSTGGTTSLVGYVREGDIYDGKAIAGATVKLSDGKSATADSNGYYKFDSVSVTTYTVTASAKCYKTGSVTKTTQSGVTNWASIALTKDSSCGNGTLTGVISDASNTNPVGNATVTLSNGTSAVSSSSGYYTFGNVPPGSYTITATANCYGSTSKSVSVAAEQTTYQDLALQPTSCGGDDGGDTSPSCLAAPVIPGTSGSSRSSGGVLAGFAAAMGLMALRRRRR